MLKKLIRFLFFVGFSLTFPLSAQSATYYLSSSTGNDANDGLSEATAWQTTEKLQLETIPYNSIILLKRGDVFRTQSEGMKVKGGKNITYGAYGTGENPIITGSFQITGWTKTTHPNLDSSTVWEADISSLPPEVNNGIQYLFVNGELMTIARYPNASSPFDDKSWLNIEQKLDSNSFIDSQLKVYGKPSGYWTGSRLRLRTYSWMYRIFEVTDYEASTGKITATGNAWQAGWGYFLDGKLTELDYQGEWYYDENTKKVYLYPKNNIDPNTALVEAASHGRAISQNIHLVENLTFRHFTGSAIKSNSNAIIRNNRFEYNKIGIYTWKPLNLLIYNNVFENTFSVAIRPQGSSENSTLGNSIIEKNQIFDTGMAPIYCSNEFEATCYGVAIQISSSGFIIRQNLIERTGWNGIYVEAPDITLENNVIRNALMRLNDGGAISTKVGNITVRGNFLLDSIGNVDQSDGCAFSKTLPCWRHPSYGMGFGADTESGASGIIIENNTVANNPHRGIRMNHFIGAQILNNTSYNNKQSQIIVGGGDHLQNNIVKNNIIYSLSADQIGLSLPKEVSNGSLDGNYYCNPYNNSIIYRKSGGGYSFAHWRKDFPLYEQSGKACSLQYNEYTVTDPQPIPVFEMLGEKDIGYHALTKGKIPFEQNQSYRLKFGVIANTFFNLKVSVSDISQGWSQEGIAFERTIDLSNQERNYEMVFKYPFPETVGRVIFSGTKDDTLTYTLKNVVIEKLNETFDPNQAEELAKQLSKLFMNTEDKPKSFPLGNTVYKDLDGKTVTGSLTLEPFTSQILIYQSGDLTLPDTPEPPPSSEQKTLTITKAGSGTISTQPTGVNCGATCAANYPINTVVTLVAEGDMDTQFVGFTGDADCVDGQVTLSNNVNCTANFEPKFVAPLETHHSLTLKATGNGFVKPSITETSSGTIEENCGIQCMTITYQTGTTIHLVAVPQNDKTVFVGWDGDCAGKQTSILVTMDANKNCTAKFDRWIEVTQVPVCSTIRKQLYGRCNAYGQTLKNITTDEWSSISNVILEGDIINRGWISNAVIKSGATVTNGVMTGEIFSEGTVIDVTFVGIKLSGGLLAGTTRNQSQVRGIIENVTLAPNAIIEGGYVGSQIVGDCEAKGHLENLTVRAGAELSCVTLGDNVVLEEGVTLDQETPRNASSRSSNQESLLSLPRLDAIATAAQKTDELVRTDAQFFGGVLGEQQVTLSLSEPLLLDIQGHIVVDSQHVSQQADIFISAIYEAVNTNNPIYYFLNKDNELIQSGKGPTGFIAFDTIETLAETITINQTIEMPDQFSSGSLKIFMGYLHDNVLVQNDKMIEVILTD